MRVHEIAATLLFALAGGSILVPVNGPPSMNGDDRISPLVGGVDAHGNVEYIEHKLPEIVLSKKEIYHYDPVEIRIENLPPNEFEGLYAQVFRDGKARPSGDGLTRIPFLPFSVDGGLDYKAVYLPDWNEKAGVVEIAVYRSGGEPFLEKAQVTLNRRPLPPVKKGLAVVNLETNGSVKNRVFVSPEGGRKDYTALLEWVRYMNADALWVLSGETTSFNPPARGDAGWNGEASPWDGGPLENLGLLKARAKEYGTDIGAYTMCFYVPGKHGVPPRYEAATGYDRESDSLYRAPHISLNSERRVKDIVELSAAFQADPEVDYIGFDFIRTGKADGYELAEEVVEGTGIRTPDGWESMTRQERVRWFARKIEVEKDPLIIEKWRWWRAHKVAGIVRRVIEEAGITKPVWVFTLGWNHGKEHGQDPVMFFDAGVTIDAVMLYEATREQFKNLLPQWRAYMNASQGNIIVGNCVDTKLLDSDGLSPPDEMFRRNMEGCKSLLAGGYAKGVFFHDLARAFWGRKGEYSARDYALAFQSSVNRLRNDLEVSKVRFDVVVRECRSEGPGKISIHGFIDMKNTSENPIDGIVVELEEPSPGADLSYYYGERRVAGFPRLEVERLESQESRRFEFSLARNTGDGDGRLRFKFEIARERVYYITELVGRTS